MLLVKTRIGVSPENGIGIFAVDRIPAGTPVWKYEPGFDQLFTLEEMNRLSPAAREQVYHYAYLDEGLGKYILCADDARFYNHSDDPNTGPDPKNPTQYLDVALRDIEAGHEINCDYKDFYADPEQIKFISGN